MKVIHLISGGDTGGAKTHVLSLLQKLNVSIHAQLVCFREGEFAQEARELGIPTAVFEGGVTEVYRRLCRYIREEGFGLIHCHGSRANMMGTLLRRSTDLPVVSTVHSDYRLDYLGRPLGRLIYGTINTVALHSFDYCIGVSDAMVDLLIARGFDPQRLYAIYNGLTFDARRTLADREGYLRGLGLQVDEDSVVVGIAARLNPVKDISTLIRGFARAEKECPGLRLVIAGDGPQLQTLRQLAGELGVSEKVCFAGWISGGMDDFYQAIDINTLTSISETFPYALTEGARFALPTVSSRVGGVPCLIDHEVNGFLFPAGDADALGGYLARLAGDPELRRSMGERLRQKAADKFSLRRTVETQLAIYSDILARHARPAEKRDGVMICGAYGKENAGDDAILSAIIAEMKRIDPHMPITVLSRRPRQTRRIYRVKAIHTFSVFSWHRRMKHTRLYISGGGSLIQDVTSRRSLWYYLYNIREAKRKRNKVMMYGCGIGPVIRENHQRLAAKCINRYVDAITLREPDSLEELRRMGVDRPETYLSADPALTLPGAAKELVDSAMLSHGVQPDGRYICFALRSWPGIQDKLEAIRSAAAFAYTRHGLTPLFLAVEKFHDPEILRRAADGLTVPCCMIDQPQDPEVIIGILARMKAVVSMRLHALIFAAGKGVPLVGIVYDPKVSAFLRYMGEELFLDLDGLEESTLCSLIDRAVQSAPDSDRLTRLLELEELNLSVARRLYRDDAGR